MIWLFKYKIRQSVGQFNARINWKWFFSLVRSNWWVQNTYICSLFAKLE